MHKYEAIEDLRVRRTRKLLRQAFIECTIEKGFAALTVRDITERAMVNRSTFYRHYLDKYDLLEQYINEMLALLEDQEERAEALLHDAPSNLINLLKHVQQFADFYRVMLGAKADSLFEQRFCQKTEKRFISYFNQAYSERMSEPDAPLLDLKDHIISAAGLSAIVWWLDQEQSCSPEQLAHGLNQFICDISVSSLKLKG